MPLRWTTALLVIGLAAVVATARGGAGDDAPVPKRFDGVFHPEFLRRDLPIIRDALALDSAQSTILEILLLDYQREFDEAADAMRDRLAEARPGLQGQSQRRERRRELSRQRRTLGERLRALKVQALDGETVDQLEIEGLKERLDGVREEIDGLRPPPPTGDERRRIESAYAQVQRDWQRRQRQLAAGLLESLKAMLNETQRAAWPAFERRMRRARTLDLGILAGESTDLLQVVATLDLDETRVTALEPLLEEYAIALDERLRRRNEGLEEHGGELADALEVGDVGRAVSLHRRELELRVALRSVNERYAVRIAAALAERGADAAAVAFAEEWRRRAYPSVYRRTRFQRVAAKALTLEGVDEQTRRAIEALLREHDARLRLLNAELVRVVRADEPDREARRLRRRLARQNGEQVPRGENRIKQAFAGRATLDDRYRRRLDGLLAPEQVARLPMSRAALLERFDLDRDGRLSSVERDAARAAGEDGG